MRIINDSIVKFSSFLHLKVINENDLVTIRSFKVSTSNFLVSILLQPVAEFKEFERRFKFKPRLKYGWFHLKLYQMFQDLSRR